MSLEIMSIALGVGSFAKLLRGKNVVIWSDNTGAEHSAGRGSCKRFDQGCLIHALWKRFLELEMAVWVERVPTQFNIADDPSREHYCLLNSLGAVPVRPVLEDVFCAPQAWASVQLSKCRRLKRRPVPSVNGSQQ